MFQPGVEYGVCHLGHLQSGQCLAKLACHEAMQGIAHIGLSNRQGNGQAWLNGFSAIKYCERMGGGDLCSRWSSHMLRIMDLA